ncbi:hypothetical protein [Spirochaeta lutea]|uniref:Uncharacterized protein n=1 Tax=Spirochaeta lutea TaxID=1480694 RepID=A0A098QZP4_9SPIO|nr:hypothetical protein [Spirochaeta lutea]KGE73320.1 hypothetical protein DC28_04555 [Spirochaeta lutea]
MLYQNVANRHWLQEIVYLNKNLFGHDFKTTFGLVGGLLAAGLYEIQPEARKIFGQPDPRNAIEIFYQLTIAIHEKYGEPVYYYVPPDFNSEYETLWRYMVARQYPYKIHWDADGGRIQLNLTLVEEQWHLSIVYFLPTMWRVIVEQNQSADGI